MDDAQLYLQQGLLLDLLGRDQEALAAFDHALKLHPDFAQAISGQAHFGKKRIYARLSNQAGEQAKTPGYTGHFQLVRTWKAHEDAIWGLAFSPDGRSLASASIDNTLKLWDIISGQELQTLQGHTKFVCSMALSPDGYMLASGDEGGTIKLWRLQ